MSSALSLSFKRCNGLFSFQRNVLHSLSLSERSTSISGTGRIPLTKIVATIGPSSEEYPQLEQIVNTGMRIMRINFSHATYEEADLRMRNLRLCKGLSALDTNNREPVLNVRGVMLDTQGPEIRTGSWGSTSKEEEFIVGQKMTLTTAEEFRNRQLRSTERPDGALVWVSYEKLLDTVPIGSCILLNDGAIELKVDATNYKTKEIECTVLNAGVLGNKKGVNMPGLVVDLPAMSEKDKMDIRWGAKNDIDYIAASFTRKAADVREIRDYAASLLRELHPKGPIQVPLIISKIESTEALVNFDEILEESDAIMVARGDLAVEIPMETLTNVQKEIVRKCNVAGKPVIVATQMLESMQKNPRPTRAECTDVANAVFDGADCVMLSGESAQGKYPIASVAMMKRIIDQSELEMQRRAPLSVLSTSSKATTSSVEAMAEAVVLASSLSSSPTHKQKVACIVVVVRSEDWAAAAEMSRLICKHRPHVPVVCAVRDIKSGRLLQLHKGLHPVVLPSDSSDEVVVAYLRTLGFLHSISSHNTKDSLRNQVLLVEAATSGDASIRLRSVE